VEDGALKEVYAAGEVYYRLDATDARADEEILIAEPIVPGTSWTLSNGATRSITAVAETVTVPYGTFEALEVTTTQPDGTVKSYYASQIGLIKTNTRPKTTLPRITSELETLTKGIPVQQTVRIYYPISRPRRIVYAEGQIALFTGDDAAEPLAAQMREARREAPCSRRCRRARRWRGETGPRDKRPHRRPLADVRAGLNVGAAFEGMVLSAVAATFGQLLPDRQGRGDHRRKRYESGHFAYKEGETVPFDITDAAPYQA
jgi:hypothetical protein